MVKYTDLGGNIVQENWESAERWLNRPEQDRVNECCPELTIIECGDTVDHKHFTCSCSDKLSENGDIKQQCMDDFKQCPLRL